MHPPDAQTVVVIPSHIPFSSARISPNTIYLSKISRWSSTCVYQSHQWTPMLEAVAALRLSTATSPLPRMFGSASQTSPDSPSLPSILIESSTPHSDTPKATKSLTVARIATLATWNTAFCQVHQFIGTPPPCFHSPTCPQSIHLIDRIHSNNHK